MASVLWMMSLGLWLTLKRASNWGEMLYSSLTGKASGFKCSCLPAISPSLLVCWRIVLSAKPELLPNGKCSKCPGKGFLSKNRFLSYFHVILSYHVLSGLILPADDIPVNSTTYFVLTLDWTLSPRHAVLSHMTRNPQRANTAMIKHIKAWSFHYVFHPNSMSNVSVSQLGSRPACHFGLSPGTKRTPHPSLISPTKSEKQGITRGIT